MKKLLFSIPLALSLCAIMLSCNSRSKSGGTGDAYTLKMRLEKNDTFNNRCDMNMKMNMEMMGQKIDMTMNMETNSAFKVLDVKGDNKELSMSITKLETSGEMAMPDGTTQQLPQSEGNDYAIGKTVTLSLDKTNKVVASTGVEDVVAGDPGMDPGTREQLKKMFSVDQMNNMYGMTFQLLPEGPVRVGDDWERENTFSMGGIEMKVTTTYKLTGVKDGVATIDVKGKLSGEGTMENQGTKVSMDISGGQNGTMEIWQNTGYIKDGRYDMDFDGDVKVMGRKVPIKVKAKYVVSDK